ncbi:unnamed protein product [Ranitomeya imitator]|uniref:Reverse transcriptase domain-containing protein n=1 Tax=Ranitomeya imitator TaxID=111125 RepID=A0ABN9KPT4_9NEOB|nr:unnamed protein product [Ranitomeya imitator]
MERKPSPEKEEGEGGTEGGPRTNQAVTSPPLLFMEICSRTIHKRLDKPPGHPIVALTDSILSLLSILLEKILTPLIKNTRSFLLDTGSFLQLIKNFGTLPQGTLLATFDVNNLYTSIQHQKRIRAMRTMLEESLMQPNVINFLMELLEIVLIKNFFMFEDQFCLQLQGTAMGSNVAPPYSNCFMSRYESEYIYPNRLYQTQCLLWHRYIDDVFCLWQGTEDSLLQFFDHVNSIWPELKFTLNINQHEINFLDTKVLQGEDGNLTLDLYTKDTDRNNLLFFQSCHPQAVKRSVPISQFERVRRIVSNPQVCTQRLEEMKDRFLQRGYPPRLLHQAQQTRNTLSRSRTSRRLPFVHTFHPFM